jgi:NSS family neurotransmitter:Na+ symporter
MAIMIAYGAYVPSGVSLLRSAVFVAVSIVTVSILSTIVIFPLVFRYGLDPAQGPKLVFEVLPVAFSEMPGGRIIGTLFFALLVLAALTPSIAIMEPSVAWLEGRGLNRRRAVLSVIVVGWCVGLVSVFSFNIGADWRPLRWLPGFATQTAFDAVDFFSSEILLPLGAILTSVLLGWRMSTRARESLAPMHPLLLMLLRYICPLGIAAVLVSAFL